MKLHFKKITRPFCVSLLLLIFIQLISPAYGFRMIHSTTIGRATAGPGVSCQDSRGFVHWDNSDIEWRTNLAARPAGTRNALRNAIQRAANSWTAVPNSAYNLRLGGDITAGFATDGINTAAWANGNGCTGGCLALTALVLRAGQVIVESDITFNNLVNWTTNGTNFDTQSVMAHELGHTLGIHHTEITGTPLPTMSSPYFGVGARTLEADDRNALQCSVNRYGDGSAQVRYRAHVKNLGWLGWVNNGATAGTTGQSRRMEAAQIFLMDAPSGMGICYRAHLQNIGWQSTRCNGSVAGTTGQSRRMEAIRIYLGGAPAGCSVEYRAHVKNLGWLSWVRNGATAGTTGQSRRMEALQVRLINCQ